MKPVLAMLIICACWSVARAERFSFASRVGVVDANGERRLCLNISDPRLAVGTEVSVVLPYKPQRMVRAVVEEKAARSCSSNPDVAPDASFYRLKLIERGQSVDLREPLPPAIGIVRPAVPVVVKKGVASGDIDGDGRAEFFHICTSMEGNHLTVWSGRPLRGKKRWHAYYYLGYDVVPTCRMATLKYRG